MESDTTSFHETALWKSNTNSSKIKATWEGSLSAIFFSQRKKIVEPTSNKLETPKSVHAWPLLQDESFALLSKHSKQGRFHVHTLYLDIHLNNSLHVKEHILFSSIKSSIQKVCSVSLVRETLRASPSLFWTWLSIKNFYEITRNSSFSVT